MASRLVHHPRQEFCKSMRKDLRARAKSFLFVYLLLLFAIYAAAVPQPRTEEKYASLDLPQLESPMTKTFAYQETGQPARIIASPSERVSLRVRRQDHEQKRNWSYPLTTPVPQMKRKAHKYRRMSHHRTERATRRNILSAEPISEAEEAHSHDEEEVDHGNEKAEEEEESEYEEEIEEEGGEEERPEEGERDLSRVETEQYSRSNEEIRKEDEHATEEITKTIRAAAERESEEDRSEEEISEKHTEKEMIAATNNHQEPSKEGAPTTDEVPKNRNLFRGIPGGAVDGTNITQVSLMVYKLVKAHDIKSIVDIPCRNNLSWFPALLQRLDFEVIGFKYMCVDKGAHKDTKLHSLFTDAGSPEFHDIEPQQSERLPKSDLVLSFDGPQQWGVRKTWSFFLGLQKSRPKFIIVTNNPGQKNNDTEKTLNLRKQPFHFTQPKRVISNVETDGKPKQLVFYDTQNIRQGF